MLRRTLGLALVTLSLACAGPPAPPSVVSDPSCAEGGWCWMRGRPLVVAGDRTTRVVIAYGAEGTFLSWNDAGRAWSAMPSPTSHTFTSAWSASESDAWASDDAGSAWHWDGRAWTETPAASPILRVLGMDDGSAWAIAGGEASGHGATSGAHLLRHDASGWSEPIAPYAFCLGGDFALPEGEVWTAGLVCDASGAVTSVEVRRWDGNAWQLVGAPIPDQGWFPSFTTTSDGRMQVDASGSFAWDGAAWTTVVPPEYPQDLGVGESAFYDGFQWVRVPWTMTIEGAFRLDESHTWAWGAGRIYFSQSRLPTEEQFQATIATPYDATASASAWGTMPTVLWAGGDARAAWGRSPSDVYRAREDGTLEHFDGAVWTPVAVSAFVRSIEGSDDEVWLATMDGVMRGDAQRGFSLVAVPSGISVPDRVHVLEDGSVIATAREAVLRVEGDVLTTLWSAEPGWYVGDASGPSTSALWILAPSAGRSNDVRLLHADAGGDLTTAWMGSFAGWGALTTTQGETWLASRGALESLDDPSERYDAMPVESFDGLAPFVTDDAVWVVAGAQAVRHAR